MRNEKRREKADWGFEQLEPRLVMAVVINEFLASNTAGILDQDGERTDWIELRNTDVAAANISGWHLTDDDADLDKWTIPAGTSIPAGGYLLVYASSKDRAVAGQQLHTNFSLEKTGEYLGLVMPDGVTVADAYAPFPAQLDDISYGRGTGGTTTDTLIAEFGQLKVLVPTTNAVDVSGANPWTALAYNEAASSAGTWTSGTSGVGYDANGVAPNLALYASTSTQAQMNSAARGSAYIRMPFQVANPADLTSLKLRIRYDDGIAVYLNGVEITAARRNAPASLTFSSAATTTHADSLSAAYEDIDLTASKGLLLTGNNVLAIHGLNRVNNATNWGDFLIAPLLQADRSLPGSVGFMTTPTPGAVNQVSTLGIVADTSFSVDRGFFSAPFNVQIATITPGAVIRYTTDGSDPTATTGTVYNPASPPLITNTTTLRAAAFKTGWTSTNIDTQSYIFLASVVNQNGAGLPSYAPWGYAGADWAMDPDVVNSPAYSSQIQDALKAIPTVSLVAPWGNWFGGAGVGIYPTASELERQTSMEFFTADGTEQWQIDGGIEVQGGTSDDRWKTDKLSMRIKFKEPYGPEKLEEDVFHNGILDAGATQEFNTFVLDAQINYTWPYGGTSAATDQRARAKYIQDQFVADLQNLAGGNAPHGRFVQLYINGLYWGMYNMHERPDEHFDESYLGGNDDDYDVLKHTADEQVSPDPPSTVAIDDYAAMLALVNQDLTIPANYAAAAAKVDVKDLATYMAINYYAGNDDWAHHNWYANFNRVDPNGKWRYNSWDAEHVLKSVTYNAIGAGEAGSPEDVHFAFMASPEYRLVFNDAVQKLFYNGGLLSPTGAAAIYQMRMDEVNLAIIGESARWGDSHTTAAEPPGLGNAYTQAHWLATQADLMANYFPQRTAIVQSQFNARSWNVALGAATFSKYGGTVASGYALTLAKPAGSPAAAKIYYTLDGSDPRDPATNLPRAGVAVEYTGSAIIINAGKQVNARIFQDLAGSSVDEWSPIIETTFLLETPFPLRITEINYNPAGFPGVGSAQELEFIELMNTGNQPISLDGVTITEFDAVPYTFPNGNTLAAGARIVLPRNLSSFTTAYGAGINVVVGPEVEDRQYADRNLSNGGERILLLGPVGETLQDITYLDGGPSDGNGKSLEIIDPLDNPNSTANWRVSYYAGGSPGTAGLAPAVAGDTDGDADVDGFDFLAWQRGAGTPALQGSASKGDADGDRDVDVADLNLLKTNYGAAPMLAASLGANQAAAVMADESSSIVVSNNVAAVLRNNEWILTDPAAPAKLAAPRPERARLVDGAFAALHQLRDAGRTWPSSDSRLHARRSAGADSRHDATDEALGQDLDEGLGAGLACDLGRSAGAVG